MTAPIEIHAPPPTTIYVPQVLTPIETREKALSPVVTTPVAVVDESTEPALSRLAAIDENNVEMIKASYEDKINKLHESYQYVICTFLSNFQR